MIRIAYFGLFPVQTERVLDVAIDNGQSDKVLAGELFASFLSPPEQQSVALGGGEDHHGSGKVLINLSAKLVAI